MMSSVISLAGSEWSAMQFQTDQEDVEGNNGFKAVLIGGYLHVFTKNRKYYRAVLEGQGELKRGQTQELNL